MAAIPRRIIQTARTRALDPIAKASAKNLQLLHPDWDYQFFDDADIRRFVAGEFPEYQSTFEAFPRGIQRVDFFRYLAVYRLGGFYFDLDMFLSESLEDLLQSECVFPFEELSLNVYLRRQYALDWDLGNYAFGACAGHEFLRAVIENCVKAQQDPTWVVPAMRPIPSLFRAEFMVLNTTGPGLVSRTFAENPALSPRILFPENVCDPRGWHQFGHYGVHQMLGSWRTGHGVTWRKLALWWESRLRRQLRLESERLGPKRSVPSAIST